MKSSINPGLKNEINNFINRIKTEKEDIEQLPNDEILNIRLRFQTYLDFYLCSDMEMDKFNFERLITIIIMYEKELEKRLNIK